LIDFAALLGIEIEIEIEIEMRCAAQI